MKNALTTFMFVRRSIIAYSQRINLENCFSCLFLNRSLFLRKLLFKNCLEKRFPAAVFFLSPFVYFSQKNKSPVLLWVRIRLKHHCSITHHNTAWCTWKEVVIKVNGWVTGFTGDQPLNATWIGELSATLPGFYIQKYIITL